MIFSLGDWIDGEGLEVSYHLEKSNPSIILIEAIPSNQQKEEQKLSKQHIQGFLQAFRHVFFGKEGDTISLASTEASTILFSSSDLLYDDDDVAMIVSLVEEGTPFSIQKASTILSSSSDLLYDDNDIAMIVSLVEEGTPFSIQKASTILSSSSDLLYDDNDIAMIVSLVEEGTPFSMQKRLFKTGIAQSEFEFTEDNYSSSLEGSSLRYLSSGEKNFSVERDPASSLDERSCFSDSLLLEEGSSFSDSQLLEGGNSLSNSQLTEGESSLNDSLSEEGESFFYPSWSERGSSFSDSLSPGRSSFEERDSLSLERRGYRWRNLAILRLFRKKS